MKNLFGTYIGAFIGVIAFISVSKVIINAIFSGEILEATAFDLSVLLTLLGVNLAICMFHFRILNERDQQS